MIHTVYGNGQGGKHRDNAEARRWRALTAELAANITAAHPRMFPGFAFEHAELEAQRITWALNRRFRLDMAAAGLR